jgi:hypothetical protein
MLKKQYYSCIYPEQHTKKDTPYRYFAACGLIFIYHK